MIHTHKGSLLDIPKGILIHGCNAQGVMGSGIALAIKNKWPQAFEDYKKSCENIGLGGTIITIINDDLMVVNAITQNGYGRNGRHVNYEAIAQSFTSAAYLCEITSLDLYFPLIGAGLGGGNWKIISTIIDETVPDSIKKTLCIL